MNYPQICNYLMKHRYPVLNSRPDLKGFDGEIQRGFALGYVFNRPGHQQKYNTKPFVRCTKLKWKNNQELFDTTCKFFKHYYPREFKFSTIQYNYNCRAAKHIDSNNAGNSVIIGIGDYTGGRLIVYDENDKPQYYDIKHKFLRFNGSKFYHEVEPYQGNRLTLVFFNLLEGTDQEHLLI